MRRLSVILVTWSALAISMASANPVRPLYEPEPPPKPVRPKVFSVDAEGGAWIGKYLTANRTFFFEPDGTISYTASTAKAAKGIKNRGFWKLEGNTIYFDHHMGGKKALMEFRGTFKDQNTIVGEAIYSNGTRATQTLERVNAVGK
jgi:hypothetical protein